MAVNLHDKYAKQIQTKFVKESVVDGNISSNFDFIGVKTVKVMTPTTVPFGNYTRSGANRYGTPTEMQDTEQELSLTQDKSFSMTIDKGNNIQQNMLKEAGKMLALQIAEQGVPMHDLYTLTTISAAAGHVEGSSTALTKGTVYEAVAEGTRYLDDAEVPEGNRTLFVSASVYKMLRLSPEWVGVEKMSEQSLRKGQVGEIDGMKVIKVPAGRWPTGLNFLIVHRDSAIAPVQLNETRLHQDPPGISGNLLEGRMIYDAFVMGQKADGVYAHIFTGTGGATQCATPTYTSATHVLATTTASASIKYTIDGTDPRYSKTAVVGTTVTGSSGDTIKAVAYKDGTFTSAIYTGTY